MILTAGAGGIKVKTAANLSKRLDAKVAAAVVATDEHRGSPGVSAGVERGGTGEGQGPDGIRWRSGAR